jgi:hypothetical protein
MMKTRVLDEQSNFGQDAQAIQALKIWFALARFCSGQNFTAWTIFNELRKAWGQEGSCSPL